MRADVVGGEDGLIANVERAAAHNRVRPAWQPLVLNLEASLLLVARRRGDRKADDVVFAEKIEVAVGVGERTLSHTAVTPHRLAGGEIEARQNRSVESVQIPVDQHD